MPENKTIIHHEFCGIYKDMIDSRLSEKFHAMRLLVATQCWSEAKSTLAKLRNDAEESNCSRDVITINQIINEIRIHEESFVDKITPVVEFQEKLTDFPQSIFFLKINEELYVGRKTLSHLWIENQIHEIHCSKIFPNMLLGQYIEHFVTESSVLLYYRPLSLNKRQELLKGVDDSNPTTNLSYPFPILSGEKPEELCSPPTGWTIDQRYANNLGQGEIHFREFTLKLIRTMDLGNGCFYDPACSTGQFLHSIKKEFPQCYTIGQDLSAEMAHYAQGYVDEIYHSNASIYPGTKLVDVAIIRFLNSEVVKTNEAVSLFQHIIPRIKRGGHVFVIGHTPVKVPLSVMMNGLKCVRTIASMNDPVHGSYIFQFYHLVKE